MTGVVVGTPNNTGCRSTAGVVGEAVKRLRRSRDVVSLAACGQLFEPVDGDDRDGVFPVLRDHYRITKNAHFGHVVPELVSRGHQGYPANRCCRHVPIVHLCMSRYCRDSVQFPAMCNINTRPATGRRTRTARTGDHRGDR